MKLSVFAIAMAALAGSSTASGLERRIVGGSAIPAKDADAYSFVTNIVVKSGDRLTACTGALLSPTTILTTAFCVADPVSNKALQLSSVAVGQGDLSAVLGKEGDAGISDVVDAGYANPQTISVHPGYNSIAYADNIAILTLPRPLANVSSSAASAKLIKKPSASESTAYTAIGWGVVTGDPNPYPAQVQQAPMAVGGKAACTDVWESYANLTNSLCVVPAKKLANVCAGDGLLVKMADDNKSVGLVGMLNLVASKDNKPADTCTEEGVADFFTTFNNYVGWLTQVTPLQESDFVSTAKFTYQKVSLNDDDDQSSDDESSSDEDSLDEVDEDGAAAGLGSLAASAATLAAAALGFLF
ncbi:hypothetical protein GGF46_001776 [Coemansia sp. RSA 552]|nr:hypothetical protein GGF46_001776 [Coemansia sp. RSA 552]